MWYVIVLAFGVWGSCWGMESFDLREVVTDSLEDDHFKAWGMAIDYYADCIERNLVVKDVDTKETVGCLNNVEYLESFLEDGCFPTTTTHIQGVLDYCSSGIVHTSPDSKALIWLPITDEFEKNDKQGLRVLKPQEEKFQEAQKQDRKFHFFGKEENTFVFCAADGNESSSTAWGVDKQNRLHTWRIYADADGEHYKPTYYQYERPIPGTITDIIPLSAVATVLSFKDKKNQERVGLAIGHMGARAFIPVEDRDVKTIQVNTQARYYKFIKADGSYNIYHTDGRRLVGPVTMQAIEDALLKRVSDQEAANEFFKEAELQATKSSTGDMFEVESEADDDEWGPEFDRIVY